MHGSAELSLRLFFVATEVYRWCASTAGSHCWSMTTRLSFCSIGSINPFGVDINGLCEICIKGNSFATARVISVQTYD